MSDSNRATFGYVAESTWGTTPTGALTTMRITGENIQDNEEVAESAEILADRNLRDLIRSGQYVSGSLNFELTPGVLDDFLEGAMASSWATNVLVNGTTKKSYSIEKKFAVDGSPATQYLAATGCRVDTLDLTFANGRVITGSLGFIGKPFASSSTSIGTSYSAAETSEILSAADVTALTEAGSSPGDVTEVTLSLKNNLRRQHAVGDTDPIGIGYGGFRVSGRMTLYFADFSLYAKYEAETKTALVVTVSDNASPASTLTFTVPKARWAAPQILIGGVNQDVLAAFPFTGIYDSSTGGALKVQRSA